MRTYCSAQIESIAASPGLGHTLMRLLRWNREPFVMRAAVAREHSVCLFGCACPLETQLGHESILERAPECTLDLRRLASACELFVECPPAVVPLPCAVAIHVRDEGERP